MLSKETIKKNISNCIEETHFKLPKKTGKVRDIYDLGDKLMFIASDRISAFDRSIANIPFKGHILNMTSVFWFNQTKDIVKNHVIDIPDPNVCIAKKLKMFPIEFVVRGYLTGSTSTSAWTAYKNGDREFCGNKLPDGMVKNQAFEKPILTPTTKDEVHDEKITPQEIIDKKLMTSDMWRKASDIALKLFNRGVEIAAKNNLILVDTKYEMGYDDDGNIYLCDEIHTPDSSRFWLKNSYEENFKKNEEPTNIDKEFLRLWFKENSDPYNDKTLPQAPEELIIELSSRYQQLFEMITGNEFKINSDEIVQKRIENNIKEYL